MVPIGQAGFFHIQIIKLLLGSVPVPIRIIGASVFEQDDAE